MTFKPPEEDEFHPAADTAGAVAAGLRNIALEYRYDYLGRRVQKLVIDATANRLIYGRRFLYDGWNLIAEFALNAQLYAPTLVRSYTWGLDIARTLSEAGGVGALLQIADHGTGRSFLPAYDGNGNVTALLNANDTTRIIDGATVPVPPGSVAAVYEYSPFGEQIRAQNIDSATADQPFRFSTKYTDSETGLVYYGRRYYAPKCGRFLGRDPKKEKGGLNLYGFCANNGVNRWDYLGMTPSGALIANIQSEIEMYDTELSQIYSDDQNSGYQAGTNPGTIHRVRQIEEQLERLYAQLGRMAQGADGNTGNPAQPQLTGGIDLTLSWSSRTVNAGPVVIFEPVHQIAIDRGLRQLPEADRAILREMAVFADRPEFQTPEMSFRHAMMDGRVDGNGRAVQTAEQARALANEFVRVRIGNAQILEREGNHAGALREFGLALHTLQDSTSPTHRGFQPWDGPNSLLPGDHVWGERKYPGDDSDLFRTTQRAWGYFDGSVPLPADFFPPGP